MHPPAPLPDSPPGTPQVPSARPATAEPQDLAGRGAFITTGAVATLALGAAATLPHLTHAGWTLALAGFALWHAGTTGSTVTSAALRRPLPVLARFLLAAALAAGAVGLCAGLLRPSAPLNEAARRLVGIGSIGLGLLAGFASILCRTTLAEGGDGALRALGQQARLAAFGFLAAGAAALGSLLTTTPLTTHVATALAAITTLLAAEAVIGSAAAFYQPATRRNAAPPLAASPLLGWAFNRRNPWETIAATLDQTFGLRVGETALFPFLRRSVEPVVLGAVVLGWLSTSVTLVPPDALGVRVHLGRFHPAALPPGPHLHAPWPFGRLEVVPALRIENVTLGFDQDLDGPILWAEQHYAGEKAFLVGNGDELLTFSLPIHYRISDPVAHLLHGRDAQAAIAALGYRELLRITTSHTSFGIMTTDRTAVAEDIRTGLQAAADDRQLGLEITWVGLKDIHPPVAVASAYQDVVSAEEERMTTVDRERAARVTSLQAAQSRALLLRREADTDARTRVAQARGDAARFTSVAEAAASDRDLFLERRRFEAATNALAPVRNLLLVPGAGRSVEFLLGVEPPPPPVPILTR